MWLEWWDVLSGLQSRCGVTRAEPTCVIDDSPVERGQFREALHTTGRGLPRIAEQTDRTEQDSLAASRGSPLAPPAGGAAGAGDCTSRSDLSHSSDMPANEREKEKMRLQKLLKDFAKECVGGIPVSVVNTRTGRMPPYLFQMDRRLATFSLRPSDGSSVESVMEDFSMRDVEYIFKGQEVWDRTPALGLDAASCVGLEMNGTRRNLVLHFDDAYERDKFYTSMQVLKMSVDIQTSK